MAAAPCWLFLWLLLTWLPRQGGCFYKFYGCCFRAATPKAASTVAVPPVVAGIFCIVFELLQVNFPGVAALVAAGPVDSATRAAHSVTAAPVAAAHMAAAPMAATTMAAALVVPALGMLLSWLLLPSSLLPWLMLPWQLLPVTAAPMAVSLEKVFLFLF
jgi:hypothetical protein